VGLGVGEAVGDSKATFDGLAMGPFERPASETERAAPAPTMATTSTAAAATASGRRSLSPRTKPGSLSRLMVIVAF
jgi:hypothetical protein